MVEITIFNAVRLWNLGFGLGFGYVAPFNPGLGFGIGFGVEIRNCKENSAQSIFYRLVCTPKGLAFYFRVYFLQNGGI